MIKTVVIVIVGGLVYTLAWTLVKEQAPVVVYLTGFLLGAFLFPAAGWLQERGL